MQMVSLLFVDGQRKMLCHDDSGGLFDGGYVVGLANDETNLAAGGTGEVYSWGTFAIVKAVDCRGQCDGCPAW